MTIPSTEPATDLAPATDAAAPPAVAETTGGARRMAVHFGVVLLGASALGTLVAGLNAGVSAGLGVLLAGANLLLMRKITQAMTATGSGSAGGGAVIWALALPFKLVALVGVAYTLVTFRVAQPVPLAMGFALLPLTGVFLPRPTSVPDLVTPHRRRRAP